MGTLAVIVVTELLNRGEDYLDYALQFDINGKVSVEDVYEYIYAEGGVDGTFTEALVKEAIKELNGSGEGSPALQDDFIFDVEGGEVREYIGTDTIIEIPGEIDGVPVARIGPGAFSGGHITSVTIPDSVTSIGVGAFDDDVIIKIGEK